MLNAHGPYNHGLWDPLIRGVSAEILENYSKLQLAEMTILDVGGYDGWILVQLQQEFGFKLAVCVEPR